MLNAAKIEEGKYTCWMFAVKNRNLTTLVQHPKITDFPRDKDGCYSVETCGNEEWPCRISKLNPKNIVLKWAYPFRQVIYCLVASILTFVLGLMAAFHFYQEGKHEQNKGHVDTDVPFSFQRETSNKTGEKEREPSVPRMAVMA